MNAKIQIAIYGHYQSIAAVCEEVVSRQLFSHIAVPDIGSCIRAGVRPELWRPAVSAFLAVHPSDVVFTGGVSGDVDWLRSIGATVWSVSDQAVIYVERKGDPRADPLYDMRDRSLTAQVNFALKVTRQICLPMRASPGLRRVAS